MLFPQKASRSRNNSCKRKNGHERDIHVYIYVQTSFQFKKRNSSNDAKEQTYHYIQENICIDKKIY